MNFLFFGLLVFSLFLLLLLSWVWPPDSPWSPWWRTDKTVARSACRLASVSKKDIVYDLGSGDGTLLFVAAEEFGAKGIGIEIDPLRYLFSVLAARIHGVKGVVFKRKNFFDEDLSCATVIFLYLVPRTLERLLPKIKKEVKKGTRIVTYKYRLSLPVVKEDKEHSLYLYKIQNYHS